jgi:hypothetical protein
MRLVCHNYYIGNDGISTHMEEIIQKCGYTGIKASIETADMCYNNFIAVHHKVRELWYNGYSHTTGPQIDWILQKLFAIFPRLDSLCTADVINFFDQCQEVSMNHLLALIPFDAILLHFQFKGLCPMGLGIIIYGAMSKGPMVLLPWLILGTLSSQVSMALALVRYESANGYNYLWCILKLTIPGFDHVVPIQVSAWTGVEDVFGFAQDYLL